MCRLRLSGFGRNNNKLYIYKIIALCLSYASRGKASANIVRCCCCPRVLPRTRRHHREPYEIRRLFAAHVLIMCIIIYTRRF